MMTRKDSTVEYISIRKTTHGAEEDQRVRNARGERTYLPWSTYVAEPSEMGEVKFYVPDEQYKVMLDSRDGWARSCSEAGTWITERFQDDEGDTPYHESIQITFEEANELLRILMQDEMHQKLEYSIEVECTYTIQAYVRVANDDEAQACAKVLANSVSLEYATEPEVYGVDADWESVDLDDENVDESWHLVG